MARSTIKPGTVCNAELEKDSIEKWGEVTYREMNQTWHLKLDDDAGTELAFDDYRMTRNYFQVLHDNVVIARFDREAMSESTPSLIGDAETRPGDPHVLPKIADPNDVVE